MNIGVSGGKGGTGKSTVACLLAGFLGGTLVDADVECPNDHIILDMQRTVQKKVMQRVPSIDSKRCRQCQACIRACQQNALVRVPRKPPMLVPEQCNGCGACALACPYDAIAWGHKEIGNISTASGHAIQLYSGELNIREPIAERVAEELLAYAITQEGAAHHHTVIDTAAGTHCQVMRALEPCDLVIAVAEPTPIGKHDLDLILRLCSVLQKRAVVVINKHGIGDARLLEDVCKEHEVSIVGHIPHTQQIRRDSSEELSERLRGHVEAIWATIGSEDNV